MISAIRRMSCHCWLRFIRNGPADINAFHQAGGVPLLLRGLAKRGLLHMDTTPLTGNMEDYLQHPLLNDKQLTWQPTTVSQDKTVLSDDDAVFNQTGGFESAVGQLRPLCHESQRSCRQYHYIDAEAAVFDSQHDVERALIKLVN